MTSWWRRLVNGEGTLQHEPIPVDDYDEDGHRPPQYIQPEDNTPGWIKWLFNGGLTSGNPYPGGDYRPPIEHGTDLQLHEVESHDPDEQAQIDLAIRQSLQEEALREDLDQDEHVLRRALEQSKKEAEESAQNNNLALAVVPPQQPPREPIRDLPDLMGTEDDFLGLGSGGQNNDLLLLEDEAIARTLQQELNLLDDSATPSTVPAGNHAGSLGLPPGAIDWSTPANPPPQAYLALPPPAASPSSSSFFPSLFDTPSSIPSLGVYCGGCKQPITSGSYLNCLGNCWHPGCFRCKACNGVITETEFKASDSSAYHTECHRQLFHPKCSVCDDYVPIQSDGVIVYRSTPFWDEKYCPAHEDDGTSRCTGCRRLENRNVPYVDLDDGRKLCLLCVDSVVIDTTECTPLFLSVTHFYEELGMPILQNIPLLCVETQALNAAREGEQRQQHGHTVETQGLCLSEEQTVQMVYRLPGLPTSGLRIGQQKKKLSRHCEVTAILVLYGLPQMLTGSILAHELMHAYLKLNGKFPRLVPQVEEGLCQIMSHLWLESQLAAQRLTAASGPVAEYNLKFTEFCLHQIASDPSEVYGDGFRRAHACVVQLGLKQTLDHVQLTGSFPET